MKNIIFGALLLSCMLLQAQLNKTVLGKWKLDTTVVTDFTETAAANQQVADKQAFYSYLNNST